MTGLSQLGQAALLTIFSVAGPILAVILVIGTLVSVFMTVTQINEPTLSFIPKFLATAAVMALLGPWLLSRLEIFTIAVFASLPRILQ
jgi:flagellar biosynthetic protein FliQ